MKAPPIAPPPKPTQPQPVAGPQQHRPVGKHYNPARPRPQQAGAILQEEADNTATEVDSRYCYNMTMETKVLHFAVNEDKKEKLLQQELVLDHAVLLPSYNYHDDIERYDKDLVLKEKEMYEEVDSIPKINYEELSKLVALLVIARILLQLQLQLLEKFMQANYERVLLQKALANTSTIQWSATQLLHPLLA